MPEPKKRQLLRVKRIDTIGLVDRGDNPEADIVFWKRDPGAGAPADDPGAARGALGDTTHEEIDMNELEKAQADLTASRAEVDALKAEVETLKAKAPAEKDVLKGLSPEARAEVEAELAKRDEANATLRKSHEALVEKMDRDAIAIRFAKGGDLEGLSGEKRTDVVLAAKKAMAPEDFTALDIILKAAAEQIRKGALFAEVGKSGDASNETAMAKIEAKAKAEKREGETVQQAIARITKENPDLYREYEQERKAR